MISSGKCITFSYISFIFFSSFLWTDYAYDGKKKIVCNNIEKKTVLRIEEMFALRHSQNSVTCLYERVLTYVCMGNI